MNPFPFHAEPEKNEFTLTSSVTSGEKESAEIINNLVKGPGVWMWVSENQTYLLQNKAGPGEAGLSGKENPAWRNMRFREGCGDTFGHRVVSGSSSTGLVPQPFAFMSPTG